ncbi:ABC transporter [Vairimorpha necatrix]|uniref:ABC transporter n=1 Tax=Vairimorpha necatrix TaxID=6039 RepID=A0AAX4J8N1_9MICR
MIISKVEEESQMKSKNHPRVSNFTIIKDVIFNDMMKNSFIKFLIIPIIITTVIYTYMEVKGSMLITEINKVIKSGNKSTDILRHYFLYFFIVLLLSEINGVVFTGVVQYICRITAKCNYENFISLPPGKFRKLGSGEIQTIIERKSKATSELVEIFIITLLPILLKMSFALYDISKVIGPLAGLIMGICIISYSIITFLISLKRAKIRKELNKSEARAVDKLQDGLSNQETIYTYQTFESEVNRYDAVLIENEKKTNDLWRIYYVQNFLQRLIFMFQTVAIIYVGMSGHLTNLITTEKFIYFISLTGTVAGSLTNVGYLYTRYSQIMVRIRSTHDIMLKSANIDTKQKDIRHFQSIICKDLSCSYDSKLVLKNINLKFFKGEKIAIIGENGCGKSTFLRVLLGFVDYEGEIIINDENINNCSLKNIISYIPQNTNLFNESVKYNITYGSENVSNAQIIDICKDFGMFRTITNLQYGFETFVGEKGIFFSGGERQKILLMRAILKKSPLLFLDESTFALDQKAKNKIMGFLLNDTTKTVLMAINETEVLNKFDRIFFITNNNIEIIDSEDFKNGRYSDALKDFVE